MAPKTDFLRSRFCDDFWVGQKNKNKTFLSGFFGTPGPLGGMREASLGGIREGKPSLVRKGMQAEGLARPGPEGGRIVYASRIPPRPIGCWRLGGLLGTRWGPKNHSFVMLWGSLWGSGGGLGVPWGRAWTSRSRLEDVLATSWRRLAAS